jgi:hypothetical protein
MRSSTKACGPSSLREMERRFREEERERAVPPPFLRRFWRADLEKWRMSRRGGLKDAR